MDMRLCGLPAQPGSREAARDPGLPDGLPNTGVVAPEAVPALLGRTERIYEERPA